MLLEYVIIMFLLNLTDFTKILFTAAEISNPCQNLTQTAMLAQ